mmetsp:Transcript_31669/g.51207  ORF Transcript_31669/g.51207 Transcript_31669/m.51207 type:complete len:145 (-) Transcript_31669:42-476(-)
MDIRQVAAEARSWLAGVWMLINYREFFLGILFSRLVETKVCVSISLCMLCISTREIRLLIMMFTGLEFAIEIEANVVENRSNRIRRTIERTPIAFAMRFDHAERIDICILCCTLMIFWGGGTLIFSSYVLLCVVRLGLTQRRLK